ncbi:MAG: exonuclease domain-containing protein [Bacteroidales bacterium]|jgi:inhibitor of KinA sporulation pathway (predicted exonuclease)|nr:exonuclease domain-containing protein [Bacteroidales bacterium]
MDATNKIIVVALGETCWEEKMAKFYNSESEIIEIGVCLLDPRRGTITRNKAILIKPEKSEVSPYCTRITTITQYLLDKRGILFKKACARLKSEYKTHQYIWASYGNHDFEALGDQCKEQNIDFPLSQNHIDVRELFKRKKKLRKRPLMHEALQILGLPLEGTYHRGVDDARNIAKILYWCISEKIMNEKRFWFL